jgi:hypothetical protein
MKILSIILLLLLLFFSAFAQSATWKINNLQKIGKFKTEILGNPKIIKTDKGKAIEFDGIDDGIFINTNPIKGFAVFTVEAIFRPDSGGTKEQRWLHIEQTKPESRVMLETRLDGNQWFVDTFMKSDENRLPHYAENFKHPLDAWYHIALIYDGKNMKHFIDGKLEMLGAIDFKPMGKGRISFGVRQNKVYWFKGAIRKVRFTDKALTPKEFLQK